VRLKLEGSWRDTWSDRGGLVTTPRPNVVVFRALDLIGGLLLGRPGFRGLRYWAVGSGDPAWGDSPPEPDRKVRRLVAETFRKPIDPVNNITFEVATRTLIVHVRFGVDEAVGTLREFGLYGGDAAPWPNSGVLFNYRAHSPIEKAASEVLDRELRISLRADDVQVGLLDLVTGLLRNRPDLRGIRYLALGTGDSAWDAAPPQGDPAAAAMKNEVARIPLVLHENLEYDPDTREVVVRTDVPFDRANVILREFGLFGGEATDARDSGTLLHWQVHPKIDKTRPIHLKRGFRLQLDPTVLVAVPDVVGAVPEAAREAIEAVSLIVGSVSEVEADPPGSVLNQRPSAGAKVVEGTPVDIAIGVARRVVVPSLLNLATTEEASAVLAAVSLELLEASPAVEESAAPAGTIIRQAPAPGTRVAEGTAVAATRATPITVEVPDLLSWPIAEAGLILLASGLRLDPGTPAQQPSVSDWGSIVAQAPEAGSRVAIDSMVAVTIASAPTIAVPNLFGLKPDEAGDRLRKAGVAVLEPLGLPSEPPGLTLGEPGLELPDSADVAIGVIFRQSPAAGDLAALYTSVRVVVAAGESVLVPDLSGLDRQAASDALEAAKLRIGRVSMEPSRTDRDTVIRQSPIAGARAATGAEVLVVLAGPIPIFMPDLVGQTEAGAREAILSVGLVLDSVVTRIDTERADRVVAQVPAADSSIARGDEVEITVARALARPTAMVDGPPFAREGRPFLLDATGSRASEGRRILKYVWTLIDPESPGPN